MGRGVRRARWRRQLGPHGRAQQRGAQGRTAGCLLPQAPPDPSRCFFHRGRASGSKPSLQSASSPVRHPIFVRVELRRCSISKETLEEPGSLCPQARGCGTGPCARFGGQHQHPPCAPWKFWGLPRCTGMGRYFGTSTALAPHASLQLSLKTEKNVLVFLLLLSSYKTLLITKSLNKPRLLKQYLKSAALQSPSQFQTFNLLRLE